MTRRDIAWRVTGLALTVTACGIGLALDRSPAIVLLFPLALFGLPLMIHGKRVAQIFRAERHGHCHTARAVHVAHIRQRGQNTDGFGY